MCIWVARRFSVSRMSTIPVRLRQNSTQRSNIDMLGWGVPISILSHISNGTFSLFFPPFFQTIAIDGKNLLHPVDISESHHIPTTMGFIGFHDVSTGWVVENRRISASGQSLDLIEKGIHPLRIATGFEKACEVGDKGLAGGKCCVLCVFVFC